MKRKAIMIFLLILTSTLFASQMVLKPQLKSVKVFLRGAEISQTASFSFLSGSNELVISGIANNIDMNSISVKGQGDFIILESKLQTNYLGDREKPSRIKVLEDSLKLLQYEIDLSQADISVNQIQMELIMANKELGTDQKAPTVADIQKMQGFFAKELASLNKKVIDIRLEIKKKEERKTKIEQQLADAKGNKNNPVNEMVITISGKKNGKGEIELTYFTYNAGWKAVYDIRVNDINSALHLFQKGSVWQSTGLNWNDLPLLLSSGNPSVGSQIPELYPWFLDFAWEDNTRYGRTQLKKGQGGEVADMIAAAPMMEAESAADYISVETKGISAEFVSDIKYNIPSDGKEHFVELKEYELTASYKYYAAPKISKDVFLSASLESWGDVVLLPGKANIFFENTYVGNTYLNPEIAVKDIKLSLGRDKSVSVKREETVDFTEDKFLSSNVERKFSYKLSIRNNRKNNVDLLLEDQYPVSQQEDIEVELLNSGGAKVDKAGGKLSWDLTIDSGKLVEKEFSFSVKYPGDRRINGL